MNSAASRWRRAISPWTERYREISNHNVGKMLGKCWENAGKMLGDLPEKGWENPFVLKMLDEHQETKLIGLRQQFFAIGSPFKKEKMTK
jgi:hypothetical protein